MRSLIRIACIAFTGRDKASRGINVARERDEFQHAIRPQAVAV